ncbi:MULTISPECIES: hypothetical protein [Rhizobium]|uniref:hypothetical protein n=1 Tax=Rhizobium TaxID=379 RepID=UPI001B33234B|nr:MULTISPECIES: hypothetical protein [Rhizobium]MBX4908834.1 hypothetical protein [Rhizobium bangladeshense]MBX5215969.1 hypothetical protein [Rhizobium sp. NLR9a]MBX5234346.1 hypothetical protein [Rhizobium sp. NLR4a]MBX5238965.1 hypothetical protein [Rhizobium sp. NLR22b]MBX5246667.1 hypothetical protein [Rhizobium sp. NLR3b]
MKHRKLLLTAIVATGILAAFAGMALPLNPLRLSGTDVVKADYREHESKGHSEEQRRREHEDDRYAANGCGGRSDDDDDDDGKAGCDARNPPMQEKANPPSNSLFTPGSKPRAQMN